MVLGQGDAGRCSQRNALVGRAKQDIKIDGTVDNGLCITAAKVCQVFTGIEQAGIEKVRAGAPGFQCEFTETQYTGMDGEVDKFALVVFHIPGDVFNPARSLSYTHGEQHAHHHSQR